MLLNCPVFAAKIPWGIKQLNLDLHVENGCLYALTKNISVHKKIPIYNKNDGVMHKE
jgi:hypothetical protein